MGRSRSTWGSISKRKPGVWGIRYPLPDDPITGLRKQGSETFYGTKKEAESRLSELRIEHERFGTYRQLTVNLCWKKYYHPYISKQLAASTVSGYESAFRTSIAPQFGDMAMEEIPVSIIKEWLSNMSYGAAKKSLAVMRAMFNFAEDEELIERNAMDRRFRLPKNQTSSRDLNDEIHDAKTLVSIFNDCTGEAWEPGFIASAFGGLRREESFGLQWDDIVFHQDYALVSIERGVQRIKGEIVVTPLKTSRSRRTAVIPAPYSTRLMAIRDERPNEVWVMDDGFGWPMDPERLSKAYMRWYLAHPYKYIPWKNLRSSFATMMAEKNVPIETVAALLGHTTTDTTYKHYEKPQNEYLASTVVDAVSKI